MRWNVHWSEDPGVLLVVCPSVLSDGSCFLVPTECVVMSNYKSCLISYQEYSLVLLHFIVC